MALARAECQSDADVYKAIRDFFVPLSEGRPLTFASLTLSLDDFISQYRPNHSFRRAMLAFLASLRPLDLADGHVVTDVSAWTTADSIASQHHIFPLAYLTKLRASTSDFHKDSVMNISWMSEQTNRDIGDSSPSEYFNGFRDAATDASDATPQSKPTFEDILASQLIPPEYTNLKSITMADYQRFLIERAGRFAAALQKALPDVPLTITISKEVEAKRKTPHRGGVRR